MALLLSHSALGRSEGIIATDLSDKMKWVEAQQCYPTTEGVFDLDYSRNWLIEYAEIITRGNAIEGIATEDRQMDTPDGPVRVRIYDPKSNGPIIVFVHGGGWVIGSIETHDHVARWLAAHTHGRVVQIEYSLAPEHPYPAGVTEVGAVLSAIIEETHRAAIFVAGDSAGANIAAMAILGLPQAARGRLSGFISLYGAYAPDMNLSSHHLYGDGRFGLSAAQMRWFWNLYAPQIPPEHRAKHLSPLIAELKDFPPTLCIGAECDMLLDDTLAFYGELSKAAVDVSLSLWTGLPHGCIHFLGIVDSVTQAANGIVQFIESHGQPHAPHREPAPIASTTMPHVDVGRLAAPAEFAPGAAEQSKAPMKLADIEPVFTTSRSRLHGSLAHRIAAEIIKGEHPPGSLLANEETASASYGVSRSAYREAIRTLAAKGLVTAQPKVGTRIAARSAWHILDPDILAWHFEFDASESFIRNLFELRKIVEPSAAALAATRRSEDEVSGLADSLARMARSSPESGGWLDAIIAFHRDLLSAGQNEAVASLWPAVETTLRWSIKLQMMSPRLSLDHDPVADHARVFELIASQNAEGALAEMALLIDSALHDTLVNLRNISAHEQQQTA